MQYWKSTDENGFVSVSTVNAKGGGNSTQEEHDAVSAMHKNAELGYGVVETETGFAYLAYPVDPDPDVDDAEALNILLGGAT